MNAFGAALQDYFLHKQKEKLWVHNSYDDPEEMPVDVFFRSEKEMPELELLAMDLCKGSILDIGAGVGSHALVLQKQHKQVTALEITDEAVEIMKKRGVKNIIHADILQYNGQPYDTLLMLMNGIGIAGTMMEFFPFLNKLDALLAEGGQIIFDSSDLSYLYKEGIPFPENRYFGEVRFKYAYKKAVGKWFNWLYIDQQTLINNTNKVGWNCEILMEDDSDQYLARLTRQ